MQIENFSFGSVDIDRHTYTHDVVIAGGKVRKRRKELSKRHRAAFGHTPLSTDEAIPWNCRRLIIGTGAAGMLPVMDDVKAEALRRHIELVAVPTEQAIAMLAADPDHTNAILHVTC